MFAPLVAYKFLLTTSLSLVNDTPRPKSYLLYDMALQLIPMILLILIASSQADIKILSVPNGRLGPEPCVRVCSGFDKDYSTWYNSRDNPGKVVKLIEIHDCGFVSPPVITAVSGGKSTWLCPSFTVQFLYSSSFYLFSVSEFTRDEMMKNNCNVYWTATGFTCNY